jgi:hypothetical protein
VSYTTLWLRGFGLTLAVEEAVAVPLLARVEPSVLRRAVIVLTVNLATHPLVWFFFPRLGLPRWAMASSAEVWAFGFEIIAYKFIFPGATWKRCVAVGTLANLASLVLGEVLASAGWLW